MNLHIPFAIAAGLFCQTSLAFQTKSTNTYRRNSPLCSHSENDGKSISLTDCASENALLGRRRLLQGAAAAASLSIAPFGVPLPAEAVTPTGPEDGLLPDLPPEAQRSYLQYRIPLQIFADFYVFEFQRLVENTDDWGEVGQLYRVSNNRGQGQPSRIEREFTNPIRILGLSMPPDIADPMRDAQFKFEKAMQQISKATAGVSRDLPVEIDKKSIELAKSSWEEGRQALNECFDVVNEATGLKEMKTIPPAGPKQIEQYGRSPGRYFNLVKKTKLCQNRGGK